MKKLYLLLLESLPIYEQLLLEESLLRTCTNNYCIINTAPPKAIVHGISQKIDTIIDTKILAQKPVPVIKRYSGGGCVAIDHNTLFVTFITESRSINFPLYPEPIHRYYGDFYEAAFSLYGSVVLKENDYCIGDKKCGGNAQYITKNRFVHHTSFLWDYDQEYMQVLKLPDKQPSYRENRSHDAFLTTLKTITPSIEHCILAIKKQLHTMFDVQVHTHFDRFALKKNHRIATTISL